MTALFGAAMFLFFGLGQLRLQFALNDMQQETTKLQAKKLALRSDINSLRSEVEGRKRGGQLLQYAEAQLGLVHYPPSQWEKMRISHDIQEHYNNAMIASANRVKGDGRTGHDGKSGEGIAGRIGLDGGMLAELGK
ncbi:hypothetical protein HY256_03035 [Candidatus Sumerlaeota bacterium]|nr:hypothetical protein [Candidatus Sumerlaeota bacterium]